MTLTHNGITYEPPVSDKEHQDFIEAKVQACNDTMMKDVIKYLSTVSVGINYIKKSWYKPKRKNKYSIQKPSYNAYSRIN